MKPPNNKHHHVLKPSLFLEPGEALWKRLPAKTEDGVTLSDFMMLIPGLNRQPGDQFDKRLASISAVMHRFEEVVAYVDLNLKINLLWVSHKPVPGSAIEIANAVQDAVPEALLIAPRFQQG